MPEGHPPSRDIATLLKAARLTNSTDVSAILVEIAAEMTSANLASAARGVGLGEQMSKAIKLIVDGYVCLNERKALKDLKSERERLAAYLKRTNGRLDHDATIKQIQEEIAIIQAGLTRLGPTA